MTMLAYRARLPAPARLMRVGCFWLARCGRWSAAATLPGVALARLVMRVEASNA